MSSSQITLTDEQLTKLADMLRRGDRMNALPVVLIDEQLTKLADMVAERVNPQQRRPFTLPEAAQAIGLSRQTIRNLIEIGKLAKVKGTGRRVLIPRTEVERFQRAQAED